MRITIIGTGYVGLVTGTCFAEMGNQVLCVDNNKEKLEKLENGIVPIYEPGLEVLFERNIREGRLHFTENLEKAIQENDFIFLCLPTPQDEDGSADLTYVLNMTEKIGSLLVENRNYKIVINKSTVPVGTAVRIKKILDDIGAENVDVASNPEFLREGFAVEDFMKPDRIVIGSKSKKALEKLEEIYFPFVKQGNPILLMDTESAEVTKYAANSYLAMRITYMNELANFCEKVGADVDLVRKGMGTDNRIGKRFLFPGIGYGGSCFPKDVNALIKTSENSGMPISILQKVDEVNKNQKLKIVEKVVEVFGGDLKGIHFAVWGLAFKPNTDDMREAPSIYIIKELLKLGAGIIAFDPAAHESAKFYFGDTIDYADDMYSSLDNADALLILTEWNEFRNPDFDKMFTKLKNKIIFDGRNVYDIKKISELGFSYYSIGRQVVNPYNNH
ncbi:MAG: UDP-glucose/GDP-mannose dehydrogenase family protein [Melioribacteraceae bacterium]|nr:UDP-glucose/GDP-mannose dehydrogenase family protein [Saprospiraceae bacterium]MCF8356416.1 UDP-glucose/GDP-mannose dehydrogenase family protein [Melioribacteraceae bacterium]